jgi:hypothetical protein
MRRPISIRDGQSSELEIRAIQRAGAGVRGGRSGPIQRAGDPGGAARWVSGRRDRAPEFGTESSRQAMLHEAERAESSRRRTEWRTALAGTRPDDARFQAAGGGPIANRERSWQIAADPSEIGLPRRRGDDNRGQDGNQLATEPGRAGGGADDGHRNPKLVL